MADLALKHPLRAFLDLSTAHLKPATMCLMADPDRLNWTCYPTDYGWFVYAHDDGAGLKHVPEEIATAMRKAQEMGAEYILYDRDAAPQPQLLTVFEH